jgi:hypothetical protein
MSTANDTTTIGNAHHRWIAAGGRTAGMVVGTMSDCVSITELTTDSAWIAGLAIVALIAAGWRKPARATAPFARGLRRSRGRTPIEVAEIDTEIHRRTPVWRRLWAVTASSAIAVVTGAVLATLVSAALAYSVVTLTDMLRR